MTKSSKPTEKAETAKKTRKAKKAVKLTGPALVIVESPAKARTIGRFLGKDFQVRASMGHVRDLPVKGLGLAMDEDGFHPTYEVIPSKAKVVKELAALARKAPCVYLATDLDREGEAIAWHLVQALDVPEERQARVTFHEITKGAIERAFENPGKVDVNRVDAQQARRILDRVVGYPLSRLLSKSISRGLSAGRVQSVALRLISEREKEIRAFDAVDYWRLFADLSADGTQFTTDLISVDDLEVAAAEDAVVPEGSEQEIQDEERRSTPEGRARRRTRELRLPSEGLAEELLAEIRGAPFVVDSVEAKRRQEWAPPPFITSTLQQQASIRLRWSTKRTMQVAQSLYEGVALADEGPTGLITYMRTDSVSLSQEAVKKCRAFIAQRFGADFVAESPRTFRSGKGAQEAHEAIRPTDPARTPEQVRGALSDDQLRLYELIWERFVACQMAAAQVDTTALRVRAGRALFEARGRVIAFAGWRQASPPRASRKAETELPQVTEGQTLELVDLRSEMRTTQPPPRYTEATLVKRLEKEGIGRPSTYADIISKIQARKYVTKQGGRFHASELGEVVTDRMIPYFPGIMDLQFTRRLEEELDLVEAGKEDWQTLLKRFHTKFQKELDAANEGMPKHKFEPAEGEPPCDECGGPVVMRFSRGEKFFGCANYPECRFTRSGDPSKRRAPIPTEHVCEKCGKGMVIREGRRGQFLSCSGFPECKNAKSILPDGSIVQEEETDQKCEKCDSPMVVKRGRRGPFLACSAFPKCRNARDLGSKPGEGRSSGDDGPADSEVELPPCPKCGAPTALRRSRRGAFCGCTKYPDCRGTAPAPKGALPKRAPTRSAGVDCPECGKAMVIRTSRRGEFAGCSGFPKCRHTMTSDELPKE